MGKNQSASNLTNIIKQDASGNIAFMSGSTMLMSLSTTGQMSGSSPAMSAVTASYADNFTVKGTLTAQTIVSQVVTSSTSLVTGSTIFGTSLSNTHIFSGSVTMNPGGLFISSSGAIGIGTITPGTALDVNGYGRVTGIGLNVTPTSIGTNPNYIRLTNTGGDFYIGQEGNTNGSFFIGSLAYDSLLYSGRPFNFIVNGVSRMYISGSGAVGIGTTTPSFLLDVNGSGRFASPSTFGTSASNGDLTIISNSSPFTIRGRTTYDRAFLGLTWDISPDAGIIVGNVLKFNVSASFGTNTGTTALTILANGKVGIGETSPDNSYQGLTIKGTDPSLRIKTTSASGWVWTEYVNSSGTNNFSMGVNQTAPYFGIRAGAGMDNVQFRMESSGRIGINSSASTYSQLNISGSTKINRSIYNWYQASWAGNSTYWHMKTNMWVGGSPSGNTQYTMSLFKGYMYAYSSAQVFEGTIGFHNWDGIFYNMGVSGNLFVTAYRSTDGFAVLVTNSGAGETGITIDWHQAYPYPFVEAIVTAAKLHGATTGGY